jgi:leader peptidase (prepilin peptidase) / N-methyltransferase
MKSSGITLAIALLGALSLALAAALDGAEPLVLARLAICGAALAGAAAYDLRERRIPNRIVVPAAILCLGLTLLSGVRLATLTAGLAIVAALLALSLARPAALGMGDVKLALLIVVGLDGQAPRALALALVLAAFASIALLVRDGRAAAKTALPLAPFLAAGALLALL